MENTDLATRGLLLLALQSQAAIRGLVVRSMLPHRMWHTVSYLLTSLGCRFHKRTRQLILYHTTSLNFILAPNTIPSCNNTRISYAPFWARFTFAPLNPHPLLFSEIYLLSVVLGVSFDANKSGITLPIWLQQNWTHLLRGTAEHKVSVVEPVR